MKNLLKRKNSLSVPKQTEATKELWTSAKGEATKY
jgi:hypothetical protein